MGDSQTSRTSGTNSSLALNGTMSTLVGATTGGSERTWNKCQRQGCRVGVTRTYTALDILFTGPETVLE